MRPLASPIRPWRSSGTAPSPGAFIHSVTSASSALTAASLRSAADHWRAKRPRAMASDARIVPRITRPATTSISVIAVRVLRRGGGGCIGARGGRGEDGIELRFILNQRHVAGDSGDEDPLFESGTGEADGVGAGEAGGG